MNDSTIRRTDSVRVKLSPAIVERLEKRAEVMGMPVATVCAVAVAEWLEQKEQSRKVAHLTAVELANKMGGIFGELVKDLSDDPQIEQMVQQRLSLAPLDGEAARRDAE